MLLHMRICSPGYSRCSACQLEGKQSHASDSHCAACAQTVHGRAFDIITPKNMADFVKDTWFNVAKRPDRERRCCLLCSEHTETTDKPCSMHCMSCMTPADCSQGWRSVP